MIVYLITAFTIFILTYFAQSKDCYSEKLTSSGKVIHTSGAKLFIILTCAILVFVAGFRYYVGTDYGGYYKMFNQNTDDLFVKLRTFDEPGYSFLCAISRLFGATDGGLAIFLASAVTITLVVFSLVRNTDEIQYALLLYVFMGGWSGSFNAVRQSLAAAFLFAGFPFLRDKKLFKFLLFVFMAFLCHRSAILMVLLCFLAHRKINLLNIVIMLLCVIILLGSYNFLFDIAGNVLDKKYDMTNTYNTTSVNVFRILVGVAPAFYFGFSLRSKEKTEIEEFFLNLLMIHAMVNVITLNSAYLARVSIYTAPFVVISISELSKTINIKYRKVTMVGIIFLYFIFWLYQLYSSDSLRDFTFIWQAPKLV